MTYYLAYCPAFGQYLPYPLVKISETSPIEKLEKLTLSVTKKIYKPYYCDISTWGNAFQQIGFGVERLPMLYKRKRMLLTYDGDAYLIYFHREQEEP